MYPTDLELSEIFFFVIIASTVWFLSSAKVNVLTEKVKIKNK